MHYSVRFVKRILKLWYNQLMNFSQNMSTVEAASGDPQADGATDESDRAMLAGPAPRHLRVDREIDGVEQVTVAAYRRVDPHALFLIPFTCLWSGFSLSGIYGPQIANRALDVKMALLGLPFVFGTIILIGMILFALFGRRTLTLRRGRGTYFRGVGPFGVTTSFEFDGRSAVRAISRMGRARHGLRIVSIVEISRPGVPGRVRVCGGFSEAAADYAAALIREECRRS